MVKAYRLRKKPVVLAVRKRPTKMTTKKVVKIAKSVALKQEETKSVIQNWGYATAKHDTVYSGQLLTNVNQAVTGQGRIGDTIYLRGFKINFVAYSNATTSKPCTLRLMVVRVKKDTSPTDAQFFEGGTTWMVNRHTNTDYCKVILDKLITLRNYAVNTHPEVHRRSYWIPINSKHVFDGNDSDNGKYYNYWTLITPFVSEGVQGTTDACYYGYDLKTYFKDA